MSPGASQALLALTGLTAGAAYLDAKFHISKDLNQLSRLSRGEQNFVRAVRQNKGSGFFLFEAAAQKYPNATCIWSREGEYTWSQTYQRVCQYGHYFRELGIESSQYAGIYLYNSPEFLFMWMGLLSIGAAPALINYNLASDALIHCVRLSGTRILVYDAATDCTTRVQGMDQQLQHLGVKTIMLSDALKTKVAQYPATRPSVKCFKENAKIFPFALMYTSGTTGLSKACPISVARNYASASLTPKSFGQQPGPNGDRTYYCIPLYHGTGGIAAMNDLMSGVSVAVAPKFSLSRFWSDCIDSRSTVFVYIGELVRYLLSAPPSSNDRQHSVRLSWGNGLSPELWTRFQERFGVAEIGEFFASTEGVFALVNYYRGGYGLGAVGHHGFLLRRKFHESYVPIKIDSETGSIWRSPTTGFAKRLPYEEGGEIIVKLPSRSAWAGYWQADEATNKKLVESVFEQGDLYYRTGDALRRSPDGLWYFVDRLGDTYRWKGENVSTTEVSQVMGSHPQVAEVNVYGVQLPSHDGRAGCAAIVFRDATSDSFDWTRLTTLLRSELPSYAVPVFIRVRSGVGGMSTDNHKHNKVPLRQEGVDPRAIEKTGDAIFWLPASSPKYIPFRKKDWDQLCQARARI